MAYNLINIGTPNDNNGDTIRNAFKKSNNNDAYLKSKVEQFEAGLPNTIKSNRILTLTPLDARLGISSSNVTGAIKIQLPQKSTHAMLKIQLEVYEFYEHKSFSAFLSGYTGSDWTKESVQIIGSTTDVNYTVRFGSNSSKMFIYIGELNTRWAHPQIAISKIMVGYRAIESESWLTGWNISFETTAFENITTTLTSNLPIAR